MKKAAIEYQRLWDTAQFESHSLSNGIKVWLQKPTILIDYEGHLSIFFKGAGSGRDPRGCRGLAHLLEHMLFCGSKNHNPESSLKEALIKNGGEANAWTNVDLTNFYARTTQDCFLNAVETLDNIVNDFCFREEDLINEKKVVLQELRGKPIAGKELLIEHMRKNIFPAKSPLLNRPLGYSSNIESISKKDLEDFYNQYYHAGNAQIICGGSFSEIPDVLEILEETFGKMRSGKEIGLLPPPVFLKSNGMYKMVDKRYAVDMVGVFYNLPPMSFPKKTPLEILFRSLSDNALSPLMLELRKKRGLIYSLNTEVRNNYYSTNLTFECETHPRNFNNVLELYFEVLLKIDEVFIQNFINYNRRRRLRAFLSPIASCEEVLNELITFGRPYSFREWEAIYDSTAAQDVLAWRDLLLKKEPLILEATCS